MCCIVGKQCETAKESGWTRSLCYAISKESKLPYQINRSSEQHSNKIIKQQSNKATNATRVVLPRPHTPHIMSCINHKVFQSLLSILLIHLNKLQIHVQISRNEQYQLPQRQINELIVGYKLYYSYILDIIYHDWGFRGGVIMREKIVLTSFWALNISTEPLITK